VSSLDVLRRICERRGLRPPEGPREHGAPLYTYQVTPPEFADLRREVAEEMGQGVGMYGASAGAFCLYAAEQICRNYAGGPWTWQLVFEALRVQAKPGEPAAWVRAGMAYWRRPIVQTASSDRLLGSLVCEGGLPLRLLADGRERYLKTFFRDIIHDAERLRLPSGQVVGRHLEALPQTLRNGTVEELGTLLADAVIALRRQLPAKLDNDPLQTLDRVDPRWRESVPLRVDETALAELLRGLLREPRPAGLGDAWLEVATVLAGASFRVERRATMPARCAAGTLAAALAIDADTLERHPRVTLSLLASSGERTPVAIAHRTRDHAAYSLEREVDAAVRQRGAVTDAIRLVASVGSREIACTAPPGGGPLLPELPWVFEGGERPLRVLRRQGAYRSSSNELVVALALDMEVMGAVSVRRLGSLGDRAVVSIAGDAVIRGADESWEIRTGADDEAELAFVLSGELRRAGFGGSEYWCGLPSIHALRPDGVRTPVQRTAIQVRHPGTTGWTVTDEQWGELDVRCTYAGTTYRTRLVALPADFAIRIDARASSIAVSGRALQAAVHGGTRYPVERGACKVLVPASFAEPVVELVLDFGRGTAKAAVPAPVRRALFEGRSGPARGPVVLDLLGQVRARATSPDPSECFTLHARIVTASAMRQTRSVTVSSMPIVQIPRAGDAAGAWELTLDAIRDHIRDLLCSSDDLDARVELRIVALGATLRPEPVLEVRRYEAKPELRRVSGITEIRLDDATVKTLSPLALERLTFELRAVTAPDQVGIALTRADDGGPRWLAPEPVLAAHPSWMLIGRVGERVRLRPTLIPGGPRATAGRLAAVLLDSHSARRRAGLGALLDEIVSDWERPEWDELDRFLKTLRSLPATTYDLVNVLGRTPGACAAALFRCTGSAEALDRVWDGLEELPFLWERLPLETWISAAKGLDRWATVLAERSDLPRASVVQLLLQPFLEHGPTVSPLLGAVRGVFARVMSGCPPAPDDMIVFCQQSGGVAALRGILDGRVQELVNRHADELWPAGLQILDVRGREIECGVSFGTQFDEEFQGVIRAPFLAGWASGSDIELHHDSLLSLRRARTFDRSWFELAHAMAFTGAAAPRLPTRS